MSNQLVNGFKGSQPFIKYKEFHNLSQDEMRNIIAQEKKALKKEYKDLKQGKRLYKQYKKLVEARNQVKKGVDIKKKFKKKAKAKKVKTFEDYFENFIKNKEIPKDTPDYLRKALERALYEHEQGIEIEKSALDKFAAKYIFEGIPGIRPPEYFNRVFTTVEGMLKNNRNVKFKMVLVCLFERISVKTDKGVEKLEEYEAFFSASNYKNLKSTNIEKLLKKGFGKILKDVEEFNLNSSNWVFKEVLRLEVHTVEYNPIKGSSYIDLPQWIKNKQAIINIKNRDDKCFIWSILRYLYPKEKDPQYLKDLRKYEFSLNTKGLTFPLKLKDITKFEKLNPEISGINVFSNDGMTIYPLRMAERDCKNTIDLFLHEEDSHYSLIKNFHRLIKSQLTKSKDGKIFICKRCFTHFTKEELLEKHIKYCSNNQTVAVKMPELNTYLHFKNYYKQLPIPFVVYGDFECFTKTMNSCTPNPKESYNYNYQKHEPSGFCFYVKSIVPGIHIKPIIYTKNSEDEEIAKIFVEKIAEVTKSIYNDFYCRPKPLRLTSEEQKLFEQAKTCHICSCELKNDKVRDHCHFTGKYRGAAHNKCNLMCKKPRVLPVIFHNLQGYDAHLFIKQLAKLEGKLDCIPSTEEKYISFSKTIKVGEYKHISGKILPINFEIKFLDSFKFLQTSLANLVSNLSSDDFNNTKHVFKSNTSLLTRKGVFPYDYVSSIDKLSETQLPPKDEFYSKLNDEDISDEDYQHAIKVWNKFGCKTIKDYHDLYLKSDVLLLADVFEKFRSTCLKHYNLDPAHYYTSPGLAWDACLK